MGSTMRAAKSGAPSRFYAPDYRRRLRELGHLAQLSLPAQVVLAALCDRANAAGLAWPSVRTIAADYGMGANTVSRAIAELTAAGLVLVARRAGKGSRYVLTTPATAEAPAPLEVAELPEEHGTHAGAASDHDRDHPKHHDQQHDQGEPARTAPRAAAERVKKDDREKASGELAGEYLPVDLVAELRQLGVRGPEAFAAYGAGVVRAAIGLLAAERKRGAVIGNAGGWLNWALKSGRAAEQLAGEAKASSMAAELEASTPATAAKFARVRRTGEVFPVVVTDGLAGVRVVDERGGVVPPQAWAHLEWLEALPEV